MTWLNDDGLFVKFGTEEATVSKGGTYNVLGPLQVSELKADYDDFGSSAAIPESSNGSYGVGIPSGVRIEKVEVIAETACTSGGSATIDIGLIRYDRSTELDYNGLVAALPLASINADGEKTELTVGSTYVGALVGTTTAYAGLLTVNYGTAALTAGKVALRVYYYNPQTIG